MTLNTILEMEKADKYMVVSIMHSLQTEPCELIPLQGKMVHQQAQQEGRYLEKPWESQEAKKNNLRKDPMFLNKHGCCNLQKSKSEWGHSGEI